MNWIDDLLGVHVRRGEVIYPKRRYLNIDDGATIADNPALDSTDITLNGGGASGVPSSRVVNGTSPIQINGGALATLAADLTISVLDATTLANGVVRLAGDLAGTAAAPVTARLNGATVPAAGALTPGHVLQVSAVAALIYGAINLANAASVTNRLSITNIGFDNPNTVLTTNNAGNATEYRLLVNANIASNAAVAVSKLQAGADGEFLRTVAGVPTWSAVTVGTGGVSPGLDTQIYVTSNPGVLTSGWATAVGDWDGAVTANVVRRLRGAAIGSAAGALTPGTVMRVTGASAIDYGAVDLANEAAVTGTLAIAHVRPHTAIAILTTNGALATEWSTTIPGGLLPNLAGDVTGAPGANTAMRIRGAAVGTAAGALVTGQSMRATGIAAADWGPIDLANENAVTNKLGIPHIAQGGAVANDILVNNGTVWGPAALVTILPPSAVQIVADVPALEALPATPLQNVCMCIVQSPRRVYHLDKTDTTSTADGDDIVTANGGWRWKFAWAA
jgi:hypothetical protein